MRRVLFTDFDDTLLNMRPLFNRFLELHYGVRIPDHIPHCGHSLEDLVLKHIPTKRRPALAALYDHIGTGFSASLEWHEEAVPVEGSVEALSSLSEMFDIYIVTARLTSARIVVKQLAERFFPGCIKGVHHAYSSNGDGTFSKVPKREFILGFDERRRAGFIDDSRIEIRNTFDVVPAFLLDPLDYYPNQNGYVRIRSWQDLADHLL